METATHAKLTEYGQLLNDKLTPTETVRRIRLQLKTAIRKAIGTDTDNPKALRWVSVETVGRMEALFRKAGAILRKRG